MSNLDPQATPFVPAYTRMFYTGPIMPPHAVHGAQPNTAYQSPGGDMKRTPLNPQAPAFVPGAGIGFRPGSTATFAHGRVQLPSHAFPPQQQVAKVPTTPPTALAYAEAAPQNETSAAPPVIKEPLPAKTQSETWAAKVKKAVSAEATQAVTAVADSATGAADSAAIASPKQMTRAKAASKAKSKASAKGRAVKSGTATDATKPTSKTAPKSATSKVSAKGGKVSEKGATSQRDQPTSSPTAAGVKTPLATPSAKVSKQDSIAANEKSIDKADGSNIMSRSESNVNKAAVKSTEGLDMRRDQGIEKSGGKQGDKAITKAADKPKASPSEVTKTDSGMKSAERPCEKVTDKIVSRAVDKSTRAANTRFVDSNGDQSPASPPETPQGKTVTGDESPKAKMSGAQNEVALETQDASDDRAFTKESTTGEADDGSLETTEVKPKSIETSEKKPRGAWSEPSEKLREEKLREKNVSVTTEDASVPQSLKREGLQSARPSASSRVSALLGSADDDDVTRYQPLLSRAPFGLKSGGSYGLKQKLQIVVAGLGTFGSGGLDKLDAETKKDVAPTSTGALGGERTLSPRGTDQYQGSVPVPSEGPSASGSASSVPSFTYTLSANNVKVYNLQDMLSIRHLPQCNKPQKPSSPSALFGMRNTVMGSSSGIFDIPSALGHKHRGLDRMLEEGSNSNWNLRASKDEPFRTNTHGSTSAASDMSWIRRPATEVPEVPKDSWQATQAAAKVKSDRNVKLQRKLKAQLNKMTPATYDDIFKAIMDLGIESIEEAQLCVNLVFEKAITNHQYIDMYAKLCHDLQKRLESDGIFNPESGSDFRRMLVQCCQTAFENNLQKPFVPPEGAEEEERFEALLLYKKKMKGNLVFVSALSMQHLVSARVLLAILTKLIDNKDSVQLEALAAFLPTVSNSLEASKLKDSFEAMFKKIRELSQDPEVEHRIRCLLLDCVEQRDRELRRNEHPQFRKVQSHVGGSGFHSVLSKTRTYQ